MSDFESYSLLDFDRGLYKAKEPWISPEKSFRELRNLKLKNGQIVKRRGRTIFGALGIAVSGESFGDGGSSDTGTLAHVPYIHPAWIANSSDPYTIEFTDGTYTGKAWRDPFNSSLAYVFQRATVTLSTGLTTYTGSLTGAANNPRSEIVFYDDGGATQTITIDYDGQSQFGDEAVVQYASGDIGAGNNTWTPASGVTQDASYDVTFAATTTGTVTVSYDRFIGYVALNTGLTYLFYLLGDWSDPVTVSYEYPSGEPIMGISNFYTLDGNEYLVVGDTNKVWLYNATTERFGNALGSFTGTDSDFLQFCSFENILIINNGVDAPQKYTPATTPATPAITDLGTDFDADTSNNIDCARFCFRLKNRLLYLRTTEGATEYANRARWTPVNDIEYSAATGDEAEYYTDAATTERIVAARIIGDDVIVLFDRRSVWRLRYTGTDPFTAFQWERINDIEGTSSPMGNVSLGNALWYRGRDGLKIADYSGVYGADAEIPDDVLNWNANAAVYSYGAYDVKEREALITYADSGETYPSHAVVANFGGDNRIIGYSTYDLPFHCFGYYRTGSVPTWDEATAGMTVDEIMWAPDDLIGSVALPIVLAGDRNGYIYQMNDGYEDDGEEIEAEFRTIRFNPYPNYQCHLAYLDIFAKAVAGGSALVYATADYDASPHSVFSIDLSPTSTEEKVMRRILVNRIAAFHTLTITESSKHEFAIDGIELHCRKAGPIRELG